MNTKLIYGKYHRAAQNRTLGEPIQSQTSHNTRDKQK
jgi:hypothetical protein